MAKLFFIYRGTKELGNLSIRLIHGTEIDYRVSSSIVSKKEYWFKRTTKKDGKTGKIHLQVKDISTSKDGKLKNHKEELEQIQKAIIDLFVIDNNKGVPITKEWLRNSITKTTAILDTKEKIDTAQQEKSTKELQAHKKKEGIFNANLLTNAVEKMFIKYQSNKGELKKYKVTLNFLLKYQKSKDQIFTIKELNQDFADHFMNWSYLDMEYSKSYTNAQLKRLRASAVRAYENDENNIVQVSKTLRTFKMFDKLYKDKIVISLDYGELDKIDSTEVLTHLEDAKKSILLGCETGLRYSDLNKLIDTNIKNISGVNYWQFRTDKTDVLVQITISQRISNLIEKYGLPTNNYPDNCVKLNRDIKKVCAKAEISEKIKGSKAKVVKINDIKEIRNKTEYHSKDQLITTRTFRRSFATNYYGKIDTALILAVTGHSTEKQLRAYINVKDESNISRTKNQIDNFHNERKEEKNNIKLTVIPKASNQN